MLIWKHVATDILVAALAAFYTGAAVEIAVLSDGSIAFALNY